MEADIAGTGVVRLVDAVDLDDAQAREAGEDAGRDPFAARIDHPDAGGHGDAGAGGDDLAVADHDGAALDRLAAIADHEPGVGDRHGLGRGGSGEESHRGKRRGGGEKELPGHHFTSPSPGWPSSKSETGRRFGSLASYSSAPSTQTISGRV